jgi:hypothetical protein
LKALAQHFVHQLKESSVKLPTTIYARLHGPLFGAGVIGDILYVAFVFSLINYFLGVGIA